MTSVYVICQEAVYRHCIGGIFTDPFEAIKTAKALAGKDQDNHHQWNVYQMALNEELVVSFTGSSFSETE